MLLSLIVQYSGVATSGRLGWSVKFCGADTVVNAMPFHKVLEGSFNAVTVLLFTA